MSRPAVVLIGFRRGAESFCYIPQTFNRFRTSSRFINNLHLILISSSFHRFLSLGRRHGRTSTYLREHRSTIAQLRNASCQRHTPRSSAYITNHPPRLVQDGSIRVSRRTNYESRPAEDEFHAPNSWLPGLRDSILCLIWWNVTKISAHS